MAPQRTPDERTTLSEWAIEHASGSSLLSASEPEPVLLDHNLLAIGRSVDDVRAVIVEWERIRRPDGGVGFVALSSSERGPSGSDPSHVVEHGVSRALRGAIPGAVVGGVLVTVVVLLVVGWSGGVLIGTLLGGAAFGAVAGAVLAFARGSSWGAAYKDSFVPVDQADVAIASIHGDDPAVVAEAISAVPDQVTVELVNVDAAGRTVPRPDTD